jgi:hypothetical protein
MPDAIGLKRSPLFVQVRTGKSGPENKQEFGGLKNTENFVSWIVQRKRFRERSPSDLDFIDSRFKKLGMLN